MRKWRLQTDSESPEVFILFIRRSNINPHRPHNRFVSEQKFSTLTGGGEDGSRPGKEAGLPTQTGTFLGGTHTLIHGFSLVC